jgi:hypothetical protein
MLCYRAMQSIEGSNRLNLTAIASFKNILGASFSVLMPSNGRVKLVLSVF